MDIENKLVVAKGVGGGRGMEWEFGISRCKLVYREWIDNKVLLYSTGNYIQSPVINHNGKECETIYIYLYIYIYIYIYIYLYIYIYICITESLCCAAEINTAL